MRHDNARRRAERPASVRTPGFGFVRREAAQRTAPQTEAIADSNDLYEADADGNTPDSFPSVSGTDPSSAQSLPLPVVSSAYSCAAPKIR